MPSAATSTRSGNSVSSKTSSRCARSCSGTCRRLPIRPTTCRCGATSSTCRCRFVRASSSLGRSRQGVRTDSHQVSRSDRPGHQGSRSVRQADRTRRPAADGRAEAGAVQGQRRAGAPLRVSGGAAVPGHVESDRAGGARQIAARRAGAEAVRHRRSRSASCFRPTATPASKSCDASVFTPRPI